MDIDKKEGDPVAEASVDDIRLDEGEVNEFVQLLDDKVDDYSRMDNQVSTRDRGATMRIKELDEKKTKPGDSPEKGKARAHTLR